MERWLTFICIFLLTVNCAPAVVRLADARTPQTYNPPEPYKRHVIHTATAMLYDDMDEMLPTDL